MNSIICTHHNTAQKLKTQTQFLRDIYEHRMMMSSNGTIFRVTGHLCGEFTGHRWIPRTKASGEEL